MDVFASSTEPAPTPASLLADVSGLITPPTVCMKLFELIKSSRASVADIGEVVALDPNLAARLLRIVNSSFYGFPARIDTISRAVSILGVRDLYNLALGIAAVRSFSKLGGGLVRTEVFWRHSVYAALLIRQLAKACGEREPERYFLAGLLHDVGICIIYSQRPALAEPARAMLAAGERDLHQAEVEALGFSHATVCGLLVEAWQLPNDLQYAVSHHHDPWREGSGRRGAALVYLADLLAHRTQEGALTGVAAEALPVDESVWSALGCQLEPRQIEDAVETANSQFADAIANLVPSRKR